MDLVKFPRTRHVEGSRHQLDDLHNDKPIAELIGKLREQLRGIDQRLETILMRVLAGTTTKDIAEEIQREPRTVRRQVNLIRAMMLELLNKEDQE